RDRGTPTPQFTGGQGWVSAPHPPPPPPRARGRYPPMSFYDVRRWVSTASAVRARPGTPSLFVMRYRRAVEKLRTLAEACESVKNWPPEDPFLLEAYVFGDVLEGADPLESVGVALVINLPPEDVPWGSSPHGTAWLADRLRLDKGGFAYWWRSHLSAVPNHHIRAPVRFWSQEGPDEAVLHAL